jgi:N4-gp56 family major capsid protein
MALTNFGALTDEQLTIWSQDLWSAARNRQFIKRFTGSGEDAMIQRVTELTKTRKGARAVITLVQDLTGDGVAGDRTLEGNEESMSQDDIVIQIDQLRNAVRHEGKMAEQKSVVRFREQARDKLSYWLADRIDQLAFLTLSGVTYDKTTAGGTRTGSDLVNLEFAGDVSTPSSSRYLVWDKTGFGVNAANTSLAADDLPTWDMLVDLKAYAKDHYVKPIRGEGGMELYHVFMTPSGIAALKKDADFLAAWRHALPRSNDNPLFKGTDTLYVDGLAIHEYRHVYHASTWGGGAIAGQRVLLCGAQALALADIGEPEWSEKGFDYDNSQGIETGKIMGFKKPKFYSIYDGSDQDFGVICVDTAV